MPSLNENSTFTLTFLGTDTEFTPFSDSLPTESPGASFLSSTHSREIHDSLSFMHASISGRGREYLALSQKEAFNKMRDGGIKHDANDTKLTHCLIEGPDTVGNKVYERIVLGVIEILNAAIRGDETINICGHSRGSVQAILVAHELDRIQKALNNTQDPLTVDLIKQVVKESDCIPESIYWGVSKRISPEPAFELYQHLLEISPESISNFKEQVAKLKVNLFVLDPVPGESCLYISTAKWEDSRFYQIADIVENYKIIGMKNELSRAFEPITPKHSENTKHHDAFSLPGHHGTACGNKGCQAQTSLLDLVKTLDGLDLSDFINESALGKDRGDLTEEDLKVSTSDVQKLFLFELYDFAQSANVQFKEDFRENIMGEVANAFFQYVDSKPTDKISVKLECYDKIASNKKAYELFNQTHYYGIGQSGDYRRILTKPFAKEKFLPGDIEREIKIEFDGRINFSSIFPLMPSGFVNEAHVSLYLQDILQMEGGLPAYIKLSQIKCTDEHTHLAELLGLNSDSDSDQSAASDRSINNRRDMFEQAMRSHIFSIMQSFLSSDDESKLPLLEMFLTVLPVPNDAQEAEGVKAFYQSLRQKVKGELIKCIETSVSEPLSQLLALSNQLVMPIFFPFSETVEMTEERKIQYKKEKDSNFFHCFKALHFELTKLKKQLILLGKLLDDIEGVDESRAFLKQRTNDINVELIKAQIIYQNKVQASQIDLPEEFGLNESCIAFRAVINEPAPKFEALQAKLTLIKTSLKTQLDRFKNERSSIDTQTKYPAIKSKSILIFGNDKGKCFEAESIPSPAKKIKKWSVLPVIYETDENENSPLEAESIVPAVKGKPTKLAGFSGVSLEILGEFSLALGIGFVAFSVTFLSTSSLGLLPAASLMVAGMALGTIGFFGVLKGAELTTNEIDNQSLLFTQSSSESKCLLTSCLI